MQGLRRVFAAASLILVTLGVSGSANASDSDYRKILGLKVWGTYYDIVLDGGDYTCGGNASNHWKLYVSTTNSDAMFRLVTSAWLSGREVNVQYSCSGTEARVSGVRAL